VSNVAENTGIKSLVGRKVKKTVKFLDADIVITKLQVSEVLDIQAKARKKPEEGEASDDLEVLRTVIRASVEGGADLTDEDFTKFPIDDLGKLSEEIMKFSGLGKDQGK